MHRVNNLLNVRQQNFQNNAHMLGEDLPIKKKKNT